MRVLNSPNNTIRFLGNESGQVLGYIAEEPKGFLAVLARQVFATHRPFRAIVMDLEGSPIMWARITIRFSNIYHSSSCSRFADHLHGSIQECSFSVARVAQRTHLVETPFLTLLEKFNKSGIHGGGGMIFLFGSSFCKFIEYGASVRPSMF